MTGPALESTHTDLANATVGAPNHVWVLIVLALFVLVVALVSGLSAYLGLCAFPVLFFGLTAGLSRWLGSADAVEHGQPAGAWQALIDQASAEMGIAPPPQAVVGQNAAGVRVIGAFRRKRIVIGQALHDRLNEQAQRAGKLDTRPILVHHEMHHVASKDLEMLGGLEHMLDVFIWASLWSAVCAIGAIGCLMLLAPPVLERVVTDPVYIDVFEKLAPIFDVRPTLIEYGQLSRTISYSLPFAAVAASFIPLLAGCFLLRRFVWNRLMQLRELYADQPTAKRFGAENTWRALNQLRFDTTYAGSISHRKDRGLRAYASGLISQLSARLRRSSSTHPDRNTREAAIFNPQAFMHALTQPRINGITVGAALLAMSLLTTSGFNLPISALWLPFVTGIAAHLALTSLVIPALGQSELPNTAADLRQAALLAGVIGFSWLIFIAAIGLAAMRYAPDTVGEIIAMIYRAVLGQIEREPDRSAVYAAAGMEFTRLLTLSLLGIPATIASTQFDLFLRRRMNAQHTNRMDALTGYVLPILLSTGFLVVSLGLAGLVISRGLHDGLAMLTGLIAIAIATGGTLWMFLRHRGRPRSRSTGD